MNCQQNSNLIVGDKMEDIRIVFGKRVRELRQDQQLSQEKLAHIAGVDRTYIAQVENGKRNISLINIKKICDALDISLSLFFSIDQFEKGERLL